ncbi:MAG: ClbS/DfsB family four-helix bundle protein [Planctomycetota bacterium]
MKYASKSQLINAIEDEHAKLLSIVESIPKRRFTEADVWGDGWNAKDLLIHLAVWEQMFLRWYNDELEGREPQVPDKDYRWRDTPELNRAIQRRHKRQSVATTLTNFARSYEEILHTARSIPEADLLTVGRFDWTGTSTLASYLGANSASHYRFASRVLRRWLRTTKT